MREPRPSAEMTYLAPGAVHSGSMRLPAADNPSRLDPDDHLVEPETRFEVFQGERVYVSPARPGHGDLHSRLDGVVGEHVATAYTTSVDLLTRRSDDNDFATDVSVRRDGLTSAWSSTCKQRWAQLPWSWWQRLASATSRSPTTPWKPGICAAASVLRIASSSSGRFR